MGFFGLISSKNLNEPLRSGKFLDERKAECPNCHGMLKKVPGAKTKCPLCGNFIYVRTRTDNVRVVVTKEDADKIDEVWRIENGIQGDYLAEQERFSSKREELRKRFGDKEPSENDIQWNLLNEDLLENVKKEQWGLYRNTRLQMAKILSKENRLKDALGIYLDICYLDLNGVTNMPLDENGNVVYSEYLKPFNSEFKFLAPGIIEIIKKVVQKLGIEREEIREMYLNSAEVQKKSTQAPLNPIDTLSELEGELFKK
jgi:hypothetical protein